MTFRSLAGGQDFARHAVVAPEQDAEHDDGGEEIGSEDRPDRNLLDQPLGENHDHSDDEYLEAAEEHEDGE